MSERLYVVYRVISGRTEYLRVTNAITNWAVRERATPLSKQDAVWWYGECLNHNQAGDIGVKPHGEV